MILNLVIALCFSFEVYVLYKHERRQACKTLEKFVLEQKNQKYLDECVSEPGEQESILDTVYLGS